MVSEGELLKQGYHDDRQRELKALRDQVKTAEDRYNRLREAAVTQIAEMLFDQRANPSHMDYYRLIAIDRLGLG